MNALVMTVLIPLIMVLTTFEDVLIFFVVNLKKFIL